MVSATFAVPFVALCTSIIAVQVPYFLDQQGTTSRSTSSQASPLDGAVLQVLLPLATTGVLFTAVAYVYSHLHHAAAAAAGAGAGNRRLWEVVTFIFCPLIGRLGFFLFFQQPAGGVDGGAQARALGAGAVHVLPAAATVTFFLGMALVFVHVCAGGEGGGGAVAGDEPIQAVVGILTEMALGAAAALIILMTMAVYAC
ncbi:uncharacterized protein LOC133930678 [Phragmites australis]|uniref:uncharacterized protein LOC133930678 n=1 Tax=Phragmites australis TaxID=29695 RepID=UPI002D7858C8|nr:uncharacterized protein LOC133930678 [Phragmites australis]